MSENDYQTGYRGGMYHQGMDRGEYERGKGQKELEDTLGGAGRKTEVPGVAFTLLLIAPLIWTVYPVLGVTILIVPAIVIAVCAALKLQGLGLLLAFVLGVFSFFPGMVLEARVSQLTVYRWVRGILRILLTFVGIAVLSAGRHAKSFNDIPPAGLVGGFFGAVIVYLIFQRLDLIYFPVAAEIKKMQAKLAKGERPTRPMLKRMFFGFCWFVPVLMVLNLGVNIVVLLMKEDPAARHAFYVEYNSLIFIVNSVIWYVLCLTGKLPGTGKYMFSKTHEDDLQQMQTT